MTQRDDLAASTRAAWDLTAKKFESGVDADVEFLRGGGVSLMAAEQELLVRVIGGGRAAHLQCSHGLDALSLLNLGCREVVGLDFSKAMLELARAKSDRLGWSARWIHSEVLDPPHDLANTFDFVYTGKGALPWISDLARWADVVAGLLRPCGYLYIYEGHPIDWIWDPEADSHRLFPERSYFDMGPRPNEDFPARAVARFSKIGEAAPLAWEYHWTLGEIVSAVARAGLRIEFLAEHQEHFWPRLEKIPMGEAERVPHTFSLLARAAAA
jgi:SAM-dependent methyltransferase